MFFKQDTPLPPFVPLPQFLMQSEHSVHAKLLYALLLGRTTLSQKNGWVSEEGNVYVIYTIAQMAKDLHCGTTAVKAALKELEQAGLLQRIRQGRNQANHIFLRLPEDAFCPMDGRRSDHPDGRKTDCPDGRNPSPNKNNKKQNDRIQNQKNRSFGSYGNQNYDHEYVDKGDCL